MGCCGEREKFGNARAEQKWDYINLSDFKSDSCTSPLSYGILYIFLLISIAVYAVDLFTAANLLFFDRWSGQVKPVISFEIARWIFAGCILLSWILLVYRWIRAVRAMKSGVVAASYLDPLGVRIQCIRMGARGRGWRRFLVFAALTKGRKGAEYVALFTYFSFEAWLRIVFAEGPRQVINALTLYSVMQADLVPAGDHAAKNGHSPISQFWINLGILADRNREQAAILIGMLFTLVIWIFSAIGLVVACLFYITFLWHHIPDSDGSLSRYCRRKIDSRLAKIVGVKVQKALAREDKLLAKQAAKVAGSGRPVEIRRKPTLPILDGSDEESSTPGQLSQQTTLVNLSGSQSFSASPNDDSKSSLRRQPTVPDIAPFTERPDAPSRTTTQSSARSNESYDSNAPLMGAAGRMGYGPPGRSFSGPNPVRSASDNAFYPDRPPISRKPMPNPQNSHQPYGPAWSSRPPPGRMTPGSRPPGPSRLDSGLSNYEPSVPPLRSGSALARPSPDGYGRQTPGLSLPLQTQTQEFELRPQLPKLPSTGSSNGQYIAYNPALHSSHSQPTRPSTTTPASGPVRNFAMPFRPPVPTDDYFGPQALSPQRSGMAPLPPQRSGTAPIPRAAAYDDSIYEMYTRDSRLEASNRPGMPPRSATAGPGIRGPGERF